MEDALYHPERGFFSRSPVGREFTTAPHISPVFAACIAQLLSQVESRLGAITMLEPACGDGTLATQIAASAPELASRVAYIGLERDRAAARLAAERVQGWLRAEVTIDLSKAPSFDGLVFANELFDNVPFHRVIGTASGPMELMVESSDGDRRLVHAPPEPAVLAALSRVPDVGEELPSSPQQRTLLRELMRKLERGWLVALDYSIRAEHPEPVRAYRGHVRVDPLEEPGSCDITGPVDMDALQAEAREQGGQVARLPQAVLLGHLGFEAFLQQLRERQLAAQQEGDLGRALVLQQTADAAEVLVDPEQLGGFEALIVAVGDVADLPFPEGSR